MVNWLTSTLTALWVSAIALLAVQNATPVSLRFLGFETIRIPVGVLLGFSASAGMVGTATLLIRDAAPKALGDRDEDDE